MNYSIVNQLGKEVNSDVWSEVALQVLPFESVSKTPIINAITYEETPNFVQISRDDTNEILSVMGKDFNPLQPTKMLSFMDNIIQSNGFKYSSGGYLDEGRKIFAQAEIGSFDILGSGDISKGYLHGATSYDGSWSRRFGYSTIRIICQNTLLMALAQGVGEKTEVKFKNTKNADEKMRQAILTLQQALDTQENFKTKMELLAQRVVSGEIVNQVVNQLLDIKDGFEVTNSQVKKKYTILDLFESNDGDAFPQFRGTAYNLVQGITEAIDHKFIENDYNRAKSAMFGNNAKLKQEGIDLVLELTKNAPLTNQLKAYSIPEKVELVESLLAKN